MGFTLSRKSQQTKKVISPLWRPRGIRSVGTRLAGSKCVSSPGFWCKQKKKIDRRIHVLVAIRLRQKYANQYPWTLLQSWKACRPTGWDVSFIVPLYLDITYSTHHSQGKFILLRLSPLSSNIGNHPNKPRQNIRLKLEHGKKDRSRYQHQTVPLISARGLSTVPRGRQERYIRPLSISGRHLSTPSNRIRKKPWYH